MQRLKTRAQFKVVLGGELVAKSSHFALHRVDLEGASSAASEGPHAPLFGGSATWLGAMVPKRCAKRAVTRNAIKRQIYTVSPSLLPPYQQAAYLVRLRREFLRKDYSSASSSALKLAVRAELFVLMHGAAAVCKPGPVAP